MNFLTLDYLKDGSEIQNKIHFVLEKHQIFDKLKEYNPILTGTFPININIKNSDLDIILETDDLMRAKDFIINEFQNQKEFDIQFNRQQLADYLNVDRSAMSNELGKMQKDRLIEVDRKHFRILDETEI